MDAFKSQVTEYCKIDDKIKELQALIKELKSQEKNLHDVLLEFMCNNNLEVCNAGDLGLITVHTTSSKASINKDSIRDGLIEVFKDKTVNSLGEWQHPPRSTVDPMKAVIRITELKFKDDGNVWVRAKIPVIGLYIRPELVYTNLSNEIAYTSIGSTQATVSDYNFQKIDVPVLLGKKIFKFGNIFHN